MVKKRSLLILIVGVIFGCLLSCGIFAAVTKSVSFNLALVTKPNIYFALTITHVNGNAVGADANKTGFLIFDNRATNAGSVVSWATVNQNCIVLNQVMAGANMPDITPETTITLKATNYTNEAGKYLHLGISYSVNAYQDFTMNNGYGVVNLAYNASESFVITAQNILANTYVQIPFLAEIDAQRFKATITANNCTLVDATRTFKANTHFRAEFSCDTMHDPMYIYTITIGTQTTTLQTTSSVVEIPANSVLGDITVVADFTTTEVWDGSVATSFASGNGTAESPFKISNGRQLALLAHLVNNANGKTFYAGEATLNGKTTTVMQKCDPSVTFATAHYELIADIYLNDERFVNQGDGYVAIYKGEEIVAFVGDGTNGSTAGEMYGNNTSTSTGYYYPVSEYSYLNIWQPIGLYYIAFSGVFYGNNKIISGLFINYTKNILKCAGLFGHVLSGGVVSDIKVVDGYVRSGSAYVAGVVGCNIANSSVISNCFNSCTIIGGSDLHTANCTGGIVGYLGGGNALCYLINCYNSGNIISNNTLTGGIAGLNRSKNNIINCYNTGKIMGVSDAGGIVGGCDRGYYSLVANCYSMGGVIAESTYDAICGNMGGDAPVVTNCYYLDAVYTGDTAYKSASAITSNLTSFVSPTTAFAATIYKNDGTTVYKNSTTATLLTHLNNYVEYYNATNPDIKAKTWVEGADGYPTFAS